MFCDNVLQKLARADKKVTDQVRGQRGVTLQWIRLRVVQFEEKVHLYSVHSVHLYICTLYSVHSVYLYTNVANVKKLMYGGQCNHGCHHVASLLSAIPGNNSVHINFTSSAIP